MPKPSLRVLLVEDDPSSLILARESIRASDLNVAEVCEVASVVEALAAWRVGSFDVAFVDYRLSDTDGLDFARQVLAADPSFLVILTTSMASRELEDEAIEVGVADFIEKQHLTPRTMARVLRYAWRRREQHEALESERRRLEASEQRRRLILENLPGSIVSLLDLDLVVVNTEGVDSDPSQYTDATTPGVPMRSFFPEESWSRLEPLLEAAKLGEHGRFQHRAQDGRLFAVDAAPFREGEQVTGVLMVWRDVTEHERARSARVEAEANLAQTFRAAPIAMGVFELDGTIVEVNQAFALMMGYAADRLRGMSAFDLGHPDEHDAMRGRLMALQHGDGGGQAQRRWRHAAGHDLWIEAHSNVLMREGKPWRVLGQIIDITGRRLTEERLRHLADHDPLTALPNRRGFERVLEHHLGVTDPPAALLVLDLDGFKAVNDTYGHDAGDQLLRQVADTLDGQLRDSDVAGRLGGDEFAVLLVGTDRDTAAGVAHRICEAVAATCRVDGRQLTVSIGAAMLDRGSLTMREAFTAADRAMYAAKDGGRKRVRLRLGGVGALAADVLDHLGQERLVDTAHAPAAKKAACAAGSGVPSIPITSTGGKRAAISR